MHWKQVCPASLDTTLHYTEIYESHLNEMNNYLYINKEKHLSK